MSDNGVSFPDGFTVEYQVGELRNGGQYLRHVTTTDKYLAKETAKALSNRKERTGENTLPSHGQIIITARAIGIWHTPSKVESLVDQLNDLWKRSGGNDINSSPGDGDRN